MRRGYTYAYKKRSAGKGAELRGVEVWIRRYARGYSILQRAYRHEHKDSLQAGIMKEHSVWWTAFQELTLELERLVQKRAELRCGSVAGGTPIAFPSLSRRLFPKESNTRA